MKAAVCFFLTLLSLRAAAPHYFLTTAAGTNPSVSAPIALNQPHVADVAAYDSKGNLYYADGQHVWRLNADGTDALFAGTYSSSATFVEGAPAAGSPLADIEDFKFDSQGNLYIALGYNIYKVTTDGTIHIFAGTGVTSIVLPATGPSIPGTRVPMRPLALAIDSEDNVYVQINLANGLNGGGQVCSGFLSFPPDGSSSAVVATAVPCQDTSFNGTTPVTTILQTAMAVSGNQMFVTLTNVSYRISLPGGPSQQPTPLPTNIWYAIGAAPNGSIVFLTYPGLAEFDPVKSTVSALPNSGGVTSASSLAVNPVTGDVALVQQGVVSVFSISSGTIQPVACDAPLFAGDGGPATLAALDVALGLAADPQGDVYVSDYDNGRIRKITPDGIISTIAGSGAPPLSGQTGSALQAAIKPNGLAIDGTGNLYVINIFSTKANEICKIDTLGRISTVAGGGSGKLIAGVAATSVSMYVSNLAADSAGDLYFSIGDIVYEVKTSGTISLIAGTGISSAVTPGTPANSAPLGFITSIAVDKSGNVYIGDNDHTSIWMVDSQGNLNLIAGNNALHNVFVNRLIPAGPAVGVNIGEPQHIVVDSQGNVYFTTLNLAYQVLLVDPSGNLTPIAGAPVQLAASSGDGADAESGTFEVISAMTMDPSGDLYLSDESLVREMTPYNPASPPPFVSQGGVVGAGGSLPAVQAVSPGGEVSIFGANFVSAANAHTVTDADLVNGKIPTTLAGVCASFGGSPAAMLGVYPGQLNVQVGSLTPRAVNVQVTTDCGTPQALTSNYSGVVVQAASPEFYSFQPDPIGGHNPIAAVNALSGAFIGPPNLLPGATFVSANAGDIVQAYAAGFGATSPAYGLGVIPGAAGTLTNPYSLTLGGTPIPAANIAYAGISPCCAGFYQVDFTVPSGIPSGAQPLVITIGGVDSPPEAYIQIGQ